MKSKEKPEVIYEEFNQRPNPVKYLMSHGYQPGEGHVGNLHDQMKHLQEIIIAYDIKYIMEIGFNESHSAQLFLHDTDVHAVVSFELGQHPYTCICKYFIDKLYPGRHTLIVGDSKTSVPKFTTLTSIKFDMIFIDGDHNYDTVKIDLLNCKALARSNTIVLMDDVVPYAEDREDFNQGPTKAWQEAVDDGLVIELGHQGYWKRERGMSWGVYKL